jgi:hypothetical protein
MPSNKLEDALKKIAEKQHSSAAAENERKTKEAKSAKDKVDRDSNVDSIITSGASKLQSLASAAGASITVTPRRALPTPTAVSQWTVTVATNRVAGQVGAIPKAPEAEFSATADDRIEARYGARPLGSIEIDALTDEWIKDRLGELLTLPPTR